MTPYLGIGWQISELHGWGIFGINVARQLLRRGSPTPRLLDEPVLDETAARELQALVQEWKVVSRTRAQQPNKDPTFLADSTVIQAFGNGFTGPGSQRRFRGDRNVGFIFFEENAFTEQQLAFGREMDVMLAGSRWNAELLKEWGFARSAFVMQGVDTERFQPRPRTGLFGDRFVIFSGGKLEIRKGQDIVLVAFREFVRRHPDAMLVTAWHNPWPATAASIKESQHNVGLPATDAATNRLMITEWLHDSGLPAGSYLDAGFLNNRDMPRYYREVDIALFPNRAEGGTNLVAMEAMASGIPCILSANTGHLDLMEGDNCYALTRQASLPGADRKGWGESDPAEIVEKLEHAYAHRAEARERGLRGAAFIGQFNWKAQTEQLISTIDTLLGNPA